MKRVYFHCLIAAACAAVALSPARGMTVAELQAQQAAGTKITVIDVRSPADFAVAHVPGAINIPASVCPLKTLPPLGAVIVYGDGLIGDPAEAAAASLAAKPGLKVDLLEGGFAEWKSTAALTTHGAGLKREELNYISYARLKAAKLGNAVLLDLRKASAAKGRRLTDLAAEFPGARVAKTRADLAAAGGGGAPVVVLIDNGDGTSEAEARKLKAGGAHSYVILAGGELILARHGQAGLERASSVAGQAPPSAAQTK